MLSMADPSVMDDAGDYYCALGWAFARGKGKPADRYERPVSLFFSCAGAAIYSVKILREIGKFDENHFCYLEDTDVGWKARINGYRNVFVPTAKVLHIGSATTGSLYNDFKVRNSSRNSIYLIYKNMPPNTAGIVGQLRAQTDRIAANSFFIFKIWLVLSALHLQKRYSIVYWKCVEGLFVLRMLCAAGT